MTVFKTICADSPYFLVAFLVHAFIQQIFMKYLLWGQAWLQRNKSVNKTIKKKKNPPAVTEFTF